MKRNLDAVTKNNKNQRGVAVIFTLGILGLLTVMALGFASTALLNNSLSKNVMNIAYARGLAKNLALTQAMYIISQKEIDSNGGLVDYRNVYSWGTDTNSVNHKDFLWKLDYTEAGDSGVQIYKYEPDQTAANPANNVRWQYVKDSSSPNNKIIGRYAYVVIPNRGRIDPSVNIGRLASNPGSAPVTPYSIPSITSDADLKKLESIISPISTTNSCYLAMKNNFRWMTFRELAKKAAISEAAYMFDCNGIDPSLTMKSPEAFRQDGKLYSRFNMNRTAEWWNSVTPSDLCGVGKTLAEFPNEQTFIPWLKDMYNKSSDLQAKALQIAANIIQYNREEGKSISNKPDVDWLTDPPTYIGIGKHPMLNEIGFMVRIKADCTSNRISEEPEIWEYEPKYIITIDNGVELVYPFGMIPEEKCFVNFSNDLEIVLKLRAVNKASDISQSETELENIFCKNEGWFGLTRKRLKLSVKGNSVEQKIEKKGLFSSSEEDIDYLSGWTSFNFSREFLNDNTSWSNNSSYTRANAFWKGVQTSSEQKKTITFGDKFKLNGSDRSEDIKKLMYFYSFEIKLGNAVLYSGETASNDTQCDYSALSEKKASYASNSFSDWAAPGEEISSKERLLLCSVEAKDPRVNHKLADWSDVKTKYDYYSGLDAKDINKNYPGTIFNTDGEPDSDLHHKNSTITGEDPDPACTKESGEGGNTTRMETAVIRHGPMRSFWELGCISRGEAWKTLNLQRKDNSASPDFTYDKGDAILFDQLKFTDENYSAGKININTDVHRVLEKLFNNALIDYKKDLGTTSGSTLPENLLLAGNVPADNQIKIGEITINTTTGKPVLHTTPAAAECIACQLINATGAYALKNRGDLLSEQATLPSETGETAPVTDNWNTLQNLLLNGGTYLEKIQILSKLMPVLRTDPVDTLYVVILAQSIRDIGGNTPVLVDWDGTGFDTAVPSSEGAAKKKAMFKAGYRRTINGAKIFSDEPTLSKTYTTNAIGTYDLGSDKITGETRLVATLVRDPAKRKWKLVRLQYAE